MTNANFQTDTPIEFRPPKPTKSLPAVPTEVRATPQRSFSTFRKMSVKQRLGEGSSGAVYLGKWGENCYFFLH